MKHFNLILSSIILAIGMFACGFDNGGFPENVKLSGKTQEKTVSGTSYISGPMQIDDLHNNRNAASFESETEDPDSLIVTLDWLTAKAKRNENKVTLITNRVPAENESKELIVGWMDGNKGISIYVKYN